MNMSFKLKMMDATQEKQGRRIAIEDRKQQIEWDHLDNYLFLHIEGMAAEIMSQNCFYF